MHRYSLVFLLFVSLVSFGCNEQETENGNEITVDGSSTVFPVTEQITKEFNTEFPDINVSIAISGTGGGFKKFMQDNVEILNASREISEEEVKEAEKLNKEYVQLLIGYDGIAIVTHPQNNWLDSLTVDELEKIWQASAQNSVTVWSDVRDEWPEEDLNLYGPGVASGTYHHFTEVILGEAGTSRGDFTSSEDDNILVQGVASDQNALGFFGMHYYQVNQEQLKLVGVNDGVGQAYKATPEAVSSGDYTPLSRPLFIYISREAAGKEAVQQYVDFYLSRAPEVIEETGYVAMADSGYKKQQEKFEAFISEADTAAVE